MVEVTQKVQTNARTGHPTHAVVQGSKRDRDLERIRAATAITKLRVEPRDVTIGEILMHPTRARFPKGGGSAEWPDDQFTRRRLKDGDIRLASDQRKART